MAQPPSTPVISRELVRFIPFASQKTFNQAALANGGVLTACFDVALAVTDPNQFLAGAIPTADPTQFAVGPFLDMGAFSSGAGRVDIDYAIDTGCLYRAVTAGGIAVPAATFTNVSGLRVTGRFVRVRFTNTSGGNVDVEFGVYLRST